MTFIAERIKLKDGAKGILNQETRGNGYYEMNMDEVMGILKILGQRLCELYRVDPEFKIELGNEPKYIEETHTIVVNNNSLISFLHELRHHMHLFGQKVLQDPEEDARAWSLRLFWKAKPSMFNKAVRENKIGYVMWDEENGYSDVAKSEEIE